MGAGGGGRAGSLQGEEERGQKSARRGEEMKVNVFRRPHVLLLCCHPRSS